MNLLIIILTVGYISIWRLAIPVFRNFWAVFKPSIH